MRECRSAERRARRHRAVLTSPTDGRERRFGVVTSRIAIGRTGLLLGALGVADVNNRGEIVGDVFGLTAEDYSKPRRIDPVLWSCALGR